MGFHLTDEAAKPLLVPYPHGEGTRRYYQDAAIRAVLEKLAKGHKRALLSLATGSGKTFIAVHLLKKIADAGQLHRALFVCDRDELRQQALGALQDVFGSDAAAISGKNPQKNARILVATYQTLDIDSDESDANFLLANYPPDYFSHIVIDECHRSAWGKWSQVLTLNPNAVQVGLTATPREIKTNEKTTLAILDAKINADNILHFGEPAYEYEISQGIEDGYLAACEIVRRDIFLDHSLFTEREAGVAQDDLGGKELTDAITGEQLTIAETKAHYNAASFEERLILPDRVSTMARDLFECLLETGGPEQKTIVFCASDYHADQVAISMNNLYAQWCHEHSKAPLSDYAFKCTAASSGGDSLPDLRAGTRHHFIATTVDLLTTGVDVPIVRNVVFFKYVGSPIAFYQMVGRGTRLHEPSGKLMFRVYDYTNATRLLSGSFVTAAPPSSKPTTQEPHDPERVIKVEGFEVRVTDAGRYILTNEGGKTVALTVEEYKERLAAKLVEAAPDLDTFRKRWVNPPERRQLMANLPDGGRSPRVVRDLEGHTDFDLYDVLGELGYGLAPKSRKERAESFSYKNKAWLAGLPDPSAATVLALTGQFARAGTEELENTGVFDTPEVKKAGGLQALKVIGSPAEVLKQTKVRLFAA